MYVLSAQFIQSKKDFFTCRVTGDAKKDGIGMNVSHVSISNKYMALVSMDHDDHVHDRETINEEEEL